MTKTIENVEIFGAGTWTPDSGGKVTITEDHLDEMVESFQVTKNELGFQPRLKLGHQETNEFFGSGKGAPNFGFIDSVRKVGDKILATFKDVPTALFDLMKAGRYNTVSVEVLPKAEVSGHQLSSVLTAVAVLGAELPAVKGLKDLADVMLAEDDNSGLLTTEGRIMLAQQTEEETPMFTQEQVDALTTAAVDKAVADVTAKFEGQIVTLKSDLEAKDAKLKEARGALVQLAEAAQTEQLTTVIDAAIEEGRALPAQREMLFAMGRTMATSEQKFAAGEDGKEVGGMEAFKAYLAAQPKQVELDVESGSSSNDRPGNFQTADDEVCHLIGVARQENTDLSFADARKQVLASIPEDLKARYVAGE